MDLLDGSALRLTVARYYTPTGRCIQKPYDSEKGFEDYYSESYHRYVNGEMKEKDSIQVNDTLKYYTEGGKVVYGGGGIVPDVFVPLPDDPELAYYNSLVRQGLIFRYAFVYTDNHRAELKRYEDFNAFNSQFRISDPIYQEFLNYAAGHGVKENKEGAVYASSRITLLLKAYVARNLFDNDGFYPLFLEMDEDYQKAIKLIQEQET